MLQFILQIISAMIKFIKFKIPRDLSQTKQGRMVVSDIGPTQNPSLTQGKK